MRVTAETTDDGAAGADPGRSETLDWSAVSKALDRTGTAVLRGLLDPLACSQLIGRYGDEDRFRSRIVMARHGFGSGEYKYFSYPLPAIVATLRSSLYAKLAPLANVWMERMGQETRFPADHAGFLERCRAAGQLRPTPLLLAYGAGDYNCLHQDLYGPTVFPLQVAILLSVPGRDFEGGEFVVVEQRPRMQSRAEVVSLGQGDGVVFAVAERPVRGARGDYRVKLRHGVSTIRAGGRYTLGIIFHDAL